MKQRVVMFVLILLIAAFVGVGWDLKRWRQPDREAFSGVRIGDAQQVVQQRLGTPLREYDRENAPADYYWSGYSKRERPISYRVLIYLGKKADLILYVWIGPDGRVEETYVGVS